MGERPGRRTGSDSTFAALAVSGSPVIRHSKAEVVTEIGATEEEPVIEISPREDPVPGRSRFRSPSRSRTRSASSGSVRSSCPLRLRADSGLARLAYPVPRRPTGIAAIGGPAAALALAQAHARMPLRLAQATILEPPCLRLPRPHTALRHTCGIYATRTPDQAREWSSHFGLDGRHQRVVGRVALWGRVLAHSGGWRAELAYPAAFEVPPQLRVGCQYPTQALAFWLEARYGVPVQIGGEVWARSRSGRAFARRRRSLGRVIGRLRP